MPEIRNPNLQTQGSGGSGGGDSRSMTYIWLLVLVFLGYETFFNKPTPAPTPTPAVPAQSQQTPGTAGAARQTPSGSQPSGPPPAAGTAKMSSAASIGAAAETETTVENELYKIVLSNRGAVVKHWILKKYLDTEGQPLDLVQQQAAQFGLPLDLFTYDPSLTTQLNQALYRVTVSGIQPAGAASLLAPTAVSYHYAANGLDVVKTLHFDSSYVVTIDTEVKRNGVPVRALVEWPAGLGDMEEFMGANRRGASTIRVSAASVIAWSLDGKQDSIAAKKVSGDATLDQPYQYAAVSDLYFAAAFLPSAPERTTLVTLHNTIDLPTDPSDATSKKTPADVIGLAVGDTSGATSLRLFAGPKSTAVLGSIHAIGADGKATGQDLGPLVHFGWMAIVAKPLFICLHFLRNLLGPGEYNWGWSIIVFTALFTLLMLPTRFMMLKSSLKMMRIQPKVEAIKKRYSNLKMNDPKRQEMNAEMMGLYKQEGVNMYGGCLPMLVQSPLFIAYYEVLENVIELRQAHWFWLTDLSAPDPLHILPILIIVSMFLTQYITPSPGMDPGQRRMMAFMMPVMFGFMLWHYASGLALYWGTSNIINLAMQIGINQSHIGKEMHAIAERRAAKKAGSAKVIQGRR